GYHQLQDAFNYVTYNGAKTLHISDNYGIEVGKPANCILLNAHDFYNALNKHVEVLYNIRHGKVLAETKPAETKVNIKRSEEHTSELQSRFDLVCRLLLEKT